MKHYYLIHISFNFDCRGVFNIGIIANDLEMHEQYSVAQEIAWEILESYVDPFKQLLEMELLEPEDREKVDVMEYEAELISYSINEISEVEFNKHKETKGFNNIEDLT